MSKIIKLEKTDIIKNKLEDIDKDMRDRLIQNSWSYGIGIEKKNQYLMFYHQLYGFASYNLNNGGWWNEKKYSKIYYFRGYPVSSKYSWVYRDTLFAKSIRCMEDEKFSQHILEAVISVNNETTRDGSERRVTSMSTILDELLIFENKLKWTNINIKSISKPKTQPSDLTKDVLRIIREEGIFINTVFENAYKHNPKLFIEYLRCASNEKISSTNNKSGYRHVEDFWNENFRSFRTICRLVTEYNYSLKSLLRYVHNYINQYEYMRVDSAYDNLKDYCSMHVQMNIDKFDKYPKFLKSRHDIILSEFMLWKKERNEELFENNVDKSLIYNDKSFCVEVPKYSKDLEFEGNKLSHCIGSYVQRVIENRCQIVFLREDRGVPLVTVEIRDNMIVNAKGENNRDVNYIEHNWLEKYAKDKGLQLHFRC